LSSQTDLQSALNLKANASSLAGYLPLSGGTMTGPITMGGNGLTQVLNILLQGGGSIGTISPGGHTFYNFIDGSNSDYLSIAPAGEGNRGYTIATAISNSSGSSNNRRKLSFPNVDSNYNGNVANNTVAIFHGRVSGTDGIDADNFATKGQLDAAIAGIGGTDNSLSEVDQNITTPRNVNMTNGSQLLFRDENNSPILVVNSGNTDNVVITNPTAQGGFVPQTDLQLASKKYVDDEIAANGGGGGLTAEQDNRLSNIEKIQSFIKTSNFEVAPIDIITSTGTTENAISGIIANETGTPLEGELQDADVCDKCKLRVRNIGAGSETTLYVVEGDTTLFRNMAGTTGNEWTTTGSSQFLGTKEAGVITVDGGTVSTRVFGNPELYTVANWLSRVPYETNASTGLNSVQVTLTRETSIIGEGLSGVRIQAADGAADRMEVPLTLANGTTYVVKFYGAVGSNILNANNWVGFTVTSPVWTPSISLANGTPQEFTATVTTNAASQIMRFYSAGTGGQDVFVDGLSIKEQ
jgi:hypothetical protein